MRSSPELAPQSSSESAVFVKNKLFYYIRNTLKAHSFDNGLGPNLNLELFPRRIAYLPLA